MQTRRLFLLGLSLVAVCRTGTALADDWPQWLGLRRDATWREQGLVTTIPANGLPVKWRVPVAEGYAGPAVMEGRVYVADYVAREGEVVGAAPRWWTTSWNAYHQAFVRRRQPRWTHRVP